MKEWVIKIQLPRLTLEMNIQPLNSEPQTVMTPRDDDERSVCNSLPNRLISVTYKYLQHNERISLKRRILCPR